MKCPECTKLGLRSKVYVGTSSSTDIPCPPFYDEDGNYHLHDLNEVRSNYSCSQGHHWSEVWQLHCPTCGDSWRKESKE
jgi:hypothetical protein